MRLDDLGATIKFVIRDRGGHYTPDLFDHVFTSDETSSPPTTGKRSTTSSTPSSPRTASATPYATPADGSCHSAQAADVLNIVTPDSAGAVLFSIVTEHRFPARRGSGPL